MLHPQRGKKTRHKSTAEKKRETQVANLDAAREYVLAELQAKVDAEDERLRQQAAALDEREKELDEREETLDQQAKGLTERETALAEQEQKASDAVKRLNGMKLNLLERERDVAERETKAQAREDALDDVEQMALAARRQIENSPSYLAMWRENFKAEISAGYEKMVRDGSYFERGY